MKEEKKFNPLPYVGIVIILVLLGIFLGIATVKFGGIDIEDTYVSTESVRYDYDKPVYADESVENKDVGYQSNQTNDPLALTIMMESMIDNVVWVVICGIFISILLKSLTRRL